MAGIMTKAVSMVLIAAVMIMVVSPQGEAAITCGTVVSYVSSCIPYVTGKGTLGGCCNGVKSLNSAAKTTVDRQKVCSCLKSIASGMSGINYGKVGGLPGQCGVKLPFKISPSTDCSKVN